MTFDDDQPCVQSIPASVTGTDWNEGKLKGKIGCKSEAPLDKTNFTMLLELKGPIPCKNRFGVDIVVVTNCSSSMEKELARLKTALRYWIKKLRPCDRVSIVTYGAKAERKSPLGSITDGPECALLKVINDLAIQPGNEDTGISAALQIASQVLSDRRHTSGRVPAIWLISSGAKSCGPNYINSFPVYTFAVGHNFDAKVLGEIAKSSGGTFSVVEGRETLSGSFSNAFSECWDGLLTVAVTDLKLVISKYKSITDLKVFAGSYRQNVDTSTGSVTISFGNLYSFDKRKVLIDVLLPAVSSQCITEVLRMTYSYSDAGDKSVQTSPLSATVKRTNSPVTQENNEVVIEQTRLQTVAMVKEARVKADDASFDLAQDILVEAQNMLEDAEVGPNQVIEMLKYELYELIKSMQSPELYRKAGRSLAYVTETAHDIQRFRTDNSVEEVKSHPEDPAMSMPEIVSEKMKGTVMNPTFRALSYHLEHSIRFLETVQVIAHANQPT